MAKLMQKAKASKGFPFAKKNDDEEKGESKPDNEKDEKDDKRPSFVKKTKEKYKP